MNVIGNFFKDIGNFFKDLASRFSGSNPSPTAEQQPLQPSQPPGRTTDRGLSAASDFNHAAKAGNDKQEQPKQPQNTTLVKKSEQLAQNAATFSDLTKQVNDKVQAESKKPGLLDKVKTAATQFKNKHLGGKEEEARNTALTTAFKSLKNASSAIQGTEQASRDPKLAAERHRLKETYQGKNNKKT